MTGLGMERTTSSLSRAVELPAGVGKARALKLAALGVQTLGDLLEYFPRRYQYESEEKRIAELVAEQIQIARGQVVAVDYVPYPRARFEATLEDDSGKMGLVWFNGAYLRRIIYPGMTIRVRGKVRMIRGLPQMANSKWNVVDETTEPITESKLRPVYPATAGLSSEIIGSIIERNLDHGVKSVAEWFEPALLKKRRLVDRARAYRAIHQPANMSEAEQARRRLVYDEFMMMQLALGISRRLRAGDSQAPMMRVDKLLDERIRKRFPFAMTGAQEKACWQIVRDLQGGRPMNRLLQGDVGSGKTAVALYAMLVTVANGMQAALLAPTEVLAEQHFLTLRNFLAGSKVRIELLTSRTRRQSRGAIYRRIADGEVDIVVGTQALLQREVEFARLGLVVADEQHRLGVRQRATLKSKAVSPHYLVMTATPIPRTLALSYFADFDLTTIDELPPGRLPVQTRWVRSRESNQAYELIREQVKKGRQAYVVVPQIDDNGDEIKSVVSEHERLVQGPLRGLRLGILHGQMPTEEKGKIMSAFRDGAIDVLVATTVIEVGIDVPNATAMLIDGAERFGLSQLHQLRGRVGRGGERAYCVLISDAPGDETEKRLRAMTSSNDGFEIAEMDLKLRGPGQFFGTRQHGLPEFKVADPGREFELLRWARDDALKLLADDPTISRPSHRALRAALLRRFGDTLQLAHV